MRKRELLADAVRDIEKASSEAKSGSELYKVVVERLAKLTHFHWTGIYLLRGDVLELEHFIGRPTEHVRIPVGKGICGSAVAKRGNVIVEDVRRESNYLACSIRTRSEIVVLIKDGEMILGELDIDSDEPAAFDAEDEAALERVADTIVRRLREIRHAPRRQGRKT